MTVDNRYQIEREIVRQQLAEEAESNDMLSWNQLQAQGQRMASTVDFSRPVPGMSGLRGGRPSYPITNAAAAGVLYGPMPDHMAAAGGRSVRTIQPPAPDRGPQRTPKIVY